MMLLLCAFTLSACLRSTTAAAPGGHVLQSLSQIEKFSGFNLTFAVDIGANRGLFTHLLKEYNPDLKILAVEGNTGQAPHLTRAFQRYSESGTVQFEIALLGKKTGEPVTFYVSHSPVAHTGNSIYREATGYFQDSHKKMVKESRQLETLDDLLARKKYTTCPDFVKIDTQGSELDIIMGSPNTFSCAKVVLFEMSLLRYNEHAPLASETIAYMNSIGFDLFDIVERHDIRLGKDGPIGLQLDGLFVRKDLDIVDTITNAIFKKKSIP